MDNRIVYWNAGMERLYGYSEQEALGQVSHELLRSEFPRPLEEIMQQFERDGRWEGEVVHYARDGKRVVIFSQWVLHRDAGGVATRIFEASTDISHHKDLELRLIAQTEELAAQAAELARAESALREQTRSLKSVLENMGEGLVAADTEGRFLMWNPAADRILGLRQADLPVEEWPAHYGTYLPDQVTLFPADQLPLVRAIRGEPCDVEMYIRNPARPDGAWLDIAARPMRDEHGAVIGGVAVFRDVTEAKAVREEIRKLNRELEARVQQRTAELEAANREMEAFTYSVSHDLRAPLRHIGGFSRILMEDYAAALPPEAAGHLRRISDSTARMGTLVDELLALSRLGRQSLELKPCDLNPLVKELIAMLQPDAEDRLVEWKITSLPPVHCDLTLIRQVFQNLLANALKFTRTRPRAVIEIGHRMRDGRVVIFVRDNGVGFDMKYADKLFGVFQRLHRADDFEGTGVGLATVQRIIQKHGGEVWGESAIDKGATFYFTLDTAAPATTPATTAAAAGCPTGA
jgi:PAS domain S-box-containing protein